MSSSVLLRLAIIFIAIGLQSCSENEHAPTTASHLLSAYEVVTPVGKLNGDFEFTEDGRIARIDWKRETPNVTQGADVYLYDANNNVSEMVRSITGLQDERVVYDVQNGKIMRSEHFVNGERLYYLFYDYDDEGKLIHSEENIRVLNGGAHARGKEFEYDYNNDGNLSQINEYSFNESTATLTLESVHTFSGFTKAPNPLQPIDPLPNIIFQKNLPTTLTVEADGHTKVYTYQYTFRADGLPSQRTATLNNVLTETLTYEY